MSDHAVRPLSKKEVDALASVDLARYIDHTNLKAEATAAAIDKLCDEAMEHRFCSVCVNSGRVAQAAARLKGSPVKVCTVVGFPLGAMSSASKAFEAKEAVQNGASEVDMVINVGALKSKDYKLAESDIRAVRSAVPAGKLLKVIIETLPPERGGESQSLRARGICGRRFRENEHGFLHRWGQGRGRRSHAEGRRRLRRRQRPRVGSEAQPTPAPCWRPGRRGLAAAPAWLL